MPTCDNCGAHVTRQYVRVFVPDDLDAPAACPSCPDRVRDAAGAAKDRRF